MHLYVHPFTHSFILTCSFLRPTFPPKLALSWPYRWTWAHIRPTLGGKVGLKNAQVLMNIWMCRWRYRWKCWTCADLFVRLAHLHAHLFIRLARLHAHLFIPYFLHPYPFQEFSVYELSKLAKLLKDLLICPSVWFNHQLGGLSSVFVVFCGSQLRHVLQRRLEEDVPPRSVRWILDDLHTQNSTWNLKISPWKRKVHLETILFRFHVKFRGCIYMKESWKHIGFGMHSGKLT